MAICPSDTLVAAGTKFPNYAGRNDVDDMLVKELTDAGITVEKYESFRDHGEVKSSVRGVITPCSEMQRCQWTFSRAWYYWIAHGEGIPLEYAERLHAIYGQVVRVDGNAGCPSPLEWNKGFAIDCYHVDTAEGLKALADTIKLVAENSKLKNHENLTGPEIVIKKQISTEIDVIISQLEKSFAKDAHDRQSDGTVCLIISGEYTKDSRNAVARQYVDRGWKKVIHKSSSENGERPGLTSFTFTLGEYK
ncbi:MAG: hypothetical protein Q7R33_04780 [Nitrosarchaeum sp.]|nr:hypothetical protein [Nitrosarchaeum sp.]